MSKISDLCAVLILTGFRDGSEKCAVRIPRVLSDLASSGMFHTGYFTAFLLFRGNLVKLHVHRWRSLLA